MLGNITPDAVKVDASQNYFICDLLATWAPMDKNKTCCQVPRQQSNADYSEALKLFTLKGKTPQKIFRTRILRCLYNISSKRQIWRNSTRASGASRLASNVICNHGTEEAIVPKICAKGFDSTYCGKNGVSYGRGSYFARDMNYSAQKTYSKPNLETEDQSMYCTSTCISFDTTIATKDTQYFV